MGNKYTISSMNEWSPHQRKTVKKALLQQFQKDPSKPDQLGGFDTATSIAVWKPNHHYAGLVLCSITSPGILSIDYLTVTGTLRGKGVGETLVKHVESLASKSGYKIIELQVDANSTTYNWYKKLGYTPKEEAHLVMGTRMINMFKNTV
jgi:ribosomal protein S18 acetylase RimI-like enzyme